MKFVSLARSSHQVGAEDETDLVGNLLHALIDGVRHSNDTIECDAGWLFEGELCRELCFIRVPGQRLPVEQNMLNVLGDESVERGVEGILICRLDERGEVFLSPGREGSKSGSSGSSGHSDDEREVVSV